MYADRGERPGLARILATLFQVMVVAVIFAVVSGEQDHFNSYYVFYGSFLFALVYVTAFRALYERVSGVLLRAAGYRRRAVLVGTGRAHRRRRAARSASGPHPAVELVGFDLAPAIARTAACARSARSPRSARRSSATASTR